MSRPYSHRLLQCGGQHRGEGWPGEGHPARSRCPAVRRLAGLQAAVPTPVMERRTFALIWDVRAWQYGIRGGPMVMWAERPPGGNMSISQEPAAGGTGGFEPEEIARLAVAAAIQAPSVHNTQPWWFSSDERELKVDADAERQLQVADPDGREMLISCGAALFNLRAALLRSAGSDCFRDTVGSEPAGQGSGGW